MRDAHGIIKELVNHKRKYEKNMENITNLFLGICPSGTKADTKEVGKNKWTEDGNKNTVTVAKNKVNMFTRFD